MSQEKGNPPDAAACKLFARNLVLAREAAGLNQRKLAVATGITQPHISEIERGLTNPSLQTMVRLASAVGVPLHELLKPL